MNNPLIWIVTALYAGQTGIFLWQGNLAGALVFGGYAVANIGVIRGFA